MRQTPLSRLPDWIRVALGLGALVVGSVLIAASARVGAVFSLLLGLGFIWGVVRDQLMSRRQLAGDSSRELRLLTQGAAFATVAAAAFAVGLLIMAGAISVEVSRVLSGGIFWIGAGICASIARDVFRSTDSE